MGNLRDKYSDEEWEEIQNKIEEKHQDQHEKFWYRVMFGENPPNEPEITHPPYEVGNIQVYTDSEGTLWDRLRGKDGTWGSWSRLGGDIDEAGVSSPTIINNEFLKEEYSVSPDECFKGQKESNNKLSYELDWEFIQAMAERMQNNKKKYPSGNWKKPIDVELLKQSLFRHVIEVMKGNYEDDGRPYGHLEAIALNSMFINHQELKCS